MQTRWKITMALLLASAGLGSWWWLRPARTNASTLVTVAADRGRLSAKVTASGTLSALVTVQVGSQVSGRVQDLLVDFNAMVKKGQVLGHLDPLFYQAALDQAKASLMVAEGNLAKARLHAVDAQRQLDRQRSLLAKEVSTQSDLDTSETNAQIALAQVTVAEGNLAQTKAALRQAEVRPRARTT